MRPTLAACLAPSAMEQVATVRVAFLEMVTFWATRAPAKEEVIEEAMVRGMWNEARDRICKLLLCRGGGFTGQMAAVLYQTPSGP